MRDFEYPETTDTLVRTTVDMAVQHSTKKVRTHSKFSIIRSTEVQLYVQLYALFVTKFKYTRYMYLEVKRSYIDPLARATTRWWPAYKLAY